MKRTPLILALFLFAIGDRVALAADLVPSFGYLAPGFAPIQSIQAGQFWNAFGFQETGIGYYTSGGPKDSSTTIWERFNPTSPYYQVFFGCYVIDNFATASEWSNSDLQVSDIQGSIQRLLALGSADQIAWLSGFQDPHPNATPDQRSIVVVKDGPRLFTMYVRFSTDSDLGFPDPLFGFYPGYNQFANMVSPNAPITVEAVLTFTYDNDHQNFVVVYASNAHWSLSDGTAKQTPAWVEFQQAKMVATTSFH
jgi:hypothetical protein